MAETTAPADEPGQRGSLTLKDRAVERVASHAALSVAGSTRHGQRGLDRVTGRDLPRVSISVTGDHVRASLDVAVEWPHSLSQVTTAVRAEVAEQVHHFSGLTVDAVDVAVAAVVQPSTATPTRRVL